jgi:hypothetical protein
MTLEKLIKQCETRLDYLKSQRHSFIQLDNSDMVNKLDTEILEMEETMSKLKEIV